MLVYDKIKTLNQKMFYLGHWDFFLEHSPTHMIAYILSGLFPAWNGLLGTVEMHYTASQTCLHYVRIFFTKKSTMLFITFSRNKLEID